MDVVDNERCENAEASGARAEIVEEDVPVVDPNSVLQIDFDEEDLGDTSGKKRICCSSFAAVFLYSQQ